MKTSNRFYPWLAAGALLLSLAAGCRSLPPVDAQARSRENEARIEKRLREILEAAEKKDFARLESYHLYGPEFTRFSGPGATRMDAAATRKLEHDGLAALEGLTMRMEALKVDVFGTTAVATFLLDYGFRAGGQAVRKMDRCTLVLVERAGEWRIVHEHLTSVPLADTAPGR